MSQRVLQRFLKLQQEIIDANAPLAKEDPRLESLGGECILCVGGDAENGPALQVFALEGDTDECWLLVSRGRVVNIYSSSATLIVAMDALLRAA